METEIETNHIIDFSDRLFWLVTGLIIVIAIGAVAYIMYDFSSLPQNTPHEITVSGSGKAYVKPDIALVSFGVINQAAKSQDAVNQNNTKMNAIITAIKSLGVADADIQTTSYNLSPVYGYSKVLQPMPADSASSGIALPPVYIDRGQVITGYSLDQEVSVKIRNFDSINSIIDKATAVGATNAGNLQFTVDNPETANAAARALAIVDAQKKIQDIAKESGLSVGKLVNLSEGYSGVIQPMYASAMGVAKSTPSVAPQIQTGQQEVDSDVTLTYQVR